VLVGCRDAARGDAVVASIQAKGGKADFVAADLRSADSARSFARRAIEFGGGHVDILVNNAAIFPMGPTPEIGEGGHRRRLRRQRQGAPCPRRRADPAMAARGKGAIINVGTVAAEFGIPGMSLYGATKASLVLLTTPHSGLLGPDRPSILR
jgi:NAD(P)-dependent dehydrogenase (short-subunit alcohol dehydrogenase family)